MVKTVEASTPKDRKTLIILKWKYCCKKFAKNDTFSSVSGGYKAVNTPFCGVVLVCGIGLLWAYNIM